MKNENMDENFETDALNLWKVRFKEPLSKEENNALILQYRQTQDKELRQKILDKIVYGNMPLAIKFLNQKYFSNDTFKKDDLLQDAAFAIMRGVELFDFEKDVSFSTYLSQAFANMLKRQFKLDKMASGTAGLSEHFPSNSRGKNCYMIEEVVKEPYFDHSWVVDKVELDNLLKNVLPKFSQVEQSIFQDTFFKDLTQGEIAQKYGVSRQYISKITTKMVKEIRNSYENGTPPKCKKNRNGLLYEPREDALAKQGNTKSKEHGKQDKTKLPGKTNSTEHDNRTK